MRVWRGVLSGLGLGVVLVGTAWAQEGPVQATAVITVMPKGGTVLPMLEAKDLKIDVDNKSAQATSVVPLRGERAGLELMVLIDDAASREVGEQIPDLRRFVNALPGGALVGVAYMQNGRAVIAQTFTGDRMLADQAFRMPHGSPGSNASPYFCLSDLAKRWPSNNPDVRREVLMVTDGLDAYGGNAFDAEDPYVLASIADAQRAHLIVHSIYYRDAGRGLAGGLGGQDYLLMVSRATGGESYYQMSGNPVSFAPYLADLQTRLLNQYELGFLAQGRGRAELQSFKVKARLPKVRIDAPAMVLIGRGGEAPFVAP